MILERSWIIWGCSKGVLRGAQQIVLLLENINGYIYLKTGSTKQVWSITAKRCWLFSMETLKTEIRSEKNKKWRILAFKRVQMSWLQIYLGFWGFLRRGLHQMTCLFPVAFPIYLGCLGECCNTVLIVLMWSSRNVWRTTKSSPRNFPSAWVGCLFQVWETLSFK